VGSIGSHTTRTRRSTDRFCFSISSIAHDPRKQYAQVGESSNTIPSTMGAATSSQEPNFSIADKPGVSLQAFNEIVHVTQHFSLFALKQVMVSVFNADNPCLRNLNLKCMHLILHCASEGWRVGNVEDS